MYPDSVWLDPAAARDGHGQGGRERGVEAWDQSGQEGAWTTVVPVSSFEMSQRTTSSGVQPARVASAPSWSMNERNELEAALC